MADFDGDPIVKRTAAAVADRLVYDADLSSTSLDRINCGVVFVHAFWAGSSFQSLRRFADTLVQVDPNQNLSFTICNIDDIEHLHHVLYAGDTTGGNGDVLWVFNGVVCARHNASRQCDFETATRSLLLKCQT